MNDSKRDKRIAELEAELGYYRAQDAQLHLCLDARDAEVERLREELQIFREGPCESCQELKAALASSDGELERTLKEKDRANTLLRDAEKELRSLRSLDEALVGQAGNHCARR